MPRSKSKPGLIGLLQLLPVLFLAACAPAAIQATDQPGITPTPVQAPQVTPGAPAPILIWEEAGNSKLSIFDDYSYRLEDYSGSGASPGGNLPEVAAQQLQTWVNRYPAFRWQSQEAEGARYQFLGQGTTGPSPADQQAIQDFLAKLVRHLAGNPTGDLPPTVAAPESGIAGEVWIGPNCPGPQRTDQPCPDQPYAATLTILATTGELVTQVQSGASGTFRVNLPPGDYILHPESPGRFPRASDQNVTVPPGQFVQVIVQYDTGMR